MHATRILAPRPISPTQQHALVNAGTPTTELLNSLASKLDLSATRRPSTPQQGDYVVPAPPPPSPIGFRAEHWPAGVRY
ncbi:uncharacterized protein J7T54_003466 [Emericellopsis cladophorae]|uniref:Uncharacterized protein n=1 Tax=Emericellopsis cladophorae TaxID=2686198 RepID=A0A9Q0BE42_9HYPO|nr:uncharacterized protein J7T54_003466 [Emericellopsis cladophorae]KAI6782047.1 hypothetical protein J7T54_003466 [Emericellopsis cladophorae]